MSNFIGSVSGGGKVETEKLEVSYFEGKGRGVIAKKAFRKGDVIERAPVIPVPAEECDDLEKTNVGSYYFSWLEDGTQGAVVLGFGSLFNHSYKPNAVYLKDYANQAFNFTAIRDIEPGEEITVNYNWDPESQIPMWFDMVGE